MAQLLEGMRELGISPNAVPDLWEAYYIAGREKYAQREEAGKRYESNWYRQFNRWLDLAPEQLEALIETGHRIAQNRTLLEWSSFVRYLIFDTRIPRQDETVINRLLPTNGLAEYRGLFLLATVLASADRIIERLKVAKISDKQIEADWGIVKSLLNVHMRNYARWGTVVDTYLTRLARGAMHVFNGLGFSVETPGFSGQIYRNVRSGETMFVAQSGKLYDLEGFRLAESEENRLLQIPGSNELLVEEQDLTLDVNELQPPVREKTELPKGVWESRYYETESGGFVANILGSDGRGKSQVRIFEANHWQPVLSEKDLALKLFVPDATLARVDLLYAAVQEAQKFWSNLTLPVLVHESWLLDPRLLTYLEEDPLSEFAAQFRLYPLPADSKETFDNVFGEKILRKPPRLWPEEDPYQIAVKTLVREGFSPLRGGGYLFPAELKAPVVSEDKREKKE